MKPTFAKNLAPLLFALVLAICGSASGQELRSANNAYLGKIQDNGAVFSDRNAQIGRIASDGKVYGANNAYLGRIAADGQVYGAKNNYLGKIDDQGWVRGANNAVIGKAQGVTPPGPPRTFSFSSRNEPLRRFAPA